MQNGAERLAQKMEKGGFAVGFAVTLAEPALSEMAGCAGYDFVFVDAEHSPLDRRDVFQHIMAAQGAGAAALVRVRAAEPAMLKAILDMGPDGVIFPFVHNADTARLAVAACTYPDGPYQGVRGQDPMRAVRYGFGEEAAYLAAPENYLLKIMQIESYEGWLNLDEILSVPGVDGVYLGPADLGRSVAAHKDLNPPSVAEICDDVCRRVRAAGKWMGVPLGTTPKNAADARERGAQWGVCGIDTALLTTACVRALRTLPCRRNKICRYLKCPWRNCAIIKGVARVPVILRNIGAKRSESWRPRGLLIPVCLLRLRRRA